MEKNKEYTMKEVVEITELSNDLLRVYEKEFDLEIARTKGGHRRYSEEDINQLITIRKKIQEQNWTYKQVRAWLHGEDITLALQDHQVTSNLEKQLEKQTEMIQDLGEKLERSIMLQVEMAKQMQELKQDKLQLEQIVERRNQDLIQALITEKRNDREEREAKKTFFQRLFSK